MENRAKILLFAAAILWACADAKVCSGPNESYDICGGMCAPTCGNPHPDPRFCPRIVCDDRLTSGCRCNDGYVREANTNQARCVLLADCP